MYFYRPGRFDKAELIDSSEVTLITPQIFQEHIMRLFVKDRSKYELAEQAFSRFAKEVLNVSHVKKGKDTSGNPSGLQQRRLTDSQQLQRRPSAVTGGE